MREIKFRAWDKQSHIWLDDDEYVIKPDSGAVAEIDYADGYVVIAADNHDAVIEQYTGLKDKNGVEIYENDIVETTYYNDIDDGLGKIGTIVFEKGGYCIIFIGDTAKNNLGWIEPDETTVIGNVHQNSDLLVDDTDRISPDDIGNDIHEFLHGGDK